MGNFDTTTYAALVGCYSGFWVITTALLLLRRNVQPIRSRGVMNVFWQTCWGMVFFQLLVYGNWSDQGCLLVYFGEVFFIPYWHWPYFLRAFRLWATFSSQFHKLSSSSHQHGEQAPILKYQKAVRFQHQFPTYLFIASSFVFVALVVYFAHDKFYYDPAVECSSNQLYLSTAEAAFSALLVVVAVVFLWKVEDELFLKQELKIVAAIGVPLFIIWAMGAFGRLFGVIPSISLVISLIFLSHIFAVVVPVLLSFNITPAYFYKVIKQSKSVELSVEYNGKKDPLLAVMENPITCKSFEKFCARSFCVENILFLKATWSFSQTFDPSTASGRAQKIVDDFLSPGCPNEVNLDEIVKTVVIEKVNEQDLSPHLFEEAAHSVYNFVRFGTFELWRKSAMCKTALQECGATNLTQLLDFDVESGKEHTLKISVDSVPN